MSATNAATTTTTATATTATATTTTTYELVFGLLFLAKLSQKSEPSRRRLSVKFVDQSFLPNPRNESPLQKS